MEFIIPISRFGYGEVVYINPRMKKPVSTTFMSYATSWESSRGPNSYSPILYTPSTILSWRTSNLKSNKMLGAQTDIPVTHNGQQGMRMKASQCTLDSTFLKRFVTPLSLRVGPDAPFRSTFSLSRTFCTTLCLQRHALSHTRTAPPQMGTSAEILTNCALAMQHMARFMATPVSFSLGLRSGVNTATERWNYSPYSAFNYNSYPVSR